MKHRGGFTLVEIVVGTAVFLVVAAAVAAAYVDLMRLATASQSRFLAVALADEQMEIIRNMPYTSVGLTNGIPQGVLPQSQTLTRGGFTFDVGLVIRNVNLSTSTIQASSKIVEVDVGCPSCSGFQPVSLTGQVSPANLQTAGSGGALVVQVFDANGVPVQGATVTVQSTATSSITDTDTTNNEGLLDIIGVPPGDNAYRITATKAGYTTARTYPPGTPNPNQIDATVVDGQATQVSLAIDKLSELDFQSIGPTCAPVGNFSFNLTGSKETSPGVPSYSQDLATDPSGKLSLTSMVWDTYTLVPKDASYDAAGITPSSPFSLSPGAAESVQLVVVPSDPDSLMAIVDDGGTGLPLSEATVELTGQGGYDSVKTTGQGYFAQTDWSHGPGQSSFDADPSAYDQGYGVDTSTTTGSIVLAQTFGQYDTAATATLESSTFDTGTTSSLYALSWLPANQPALAGPAPVAFQVASAPSSSPNGPWSFLGPDGTPNSYYSAPGIAISSANDTGEYVRYMAYLKTDTATVTPDVTDVSFTYTSGCVPPGEVLFQGLAAGTYTMTVSKSGYAQSVSQVTVGSGWQSETVSLSPQ
ncbi:MAG: carboxypeptidase regulatory-like domain-containing protein [Patescibacteria group bacterium]|nr:carboxypeptidase regulatory-like domain-containing protein [Patescibacteria group bacterium]